ncbi:MAG: DNRLRE domain-containing protein, partial [Acidimicrobiia bacterium]|nr:DNRLRE domain-containing protein [Acidimicrobiia bacterium]
VSVVSETCATNEQPTYFVRTCFLSPTQQLTIDGDTPVEVSVEPEGEFPGIRRMVFYINDEYVLTDYEAPYHFVLPAASFPSGPATLAVEAVLRDDTIAPQVSIELTIDRVEVAFDVPAPGFRPALGTSPPSGTPFVIAAVGDGASGRRAADQVVDVIRNMAPNMVLYLGDVYERGSYTEFRNWYGTSGESWDQFSGITNPVVGNHERLTEASAGYFEYWNDPPLYYSLNVNGWTVIALDLQATRPSEEQLAWLQDQLVSSNECTLVMQHHPVFSVGPHGDHQDADELWPLFAEAGVDLLLAGHEHNYQRWLPLGSDMQPDEEGPLQIIVGTGGHGIRPTNGSDERAATVFDAAPAAFGALRLELNQTGAVATYLDIGGETLDWTARSCSDAAVDVTPPSQPREPSGFAPDGNRVELEWARSQDDTAVGAYLIERDGIVVGEASGGNRSFTDMTVDANTLYEYQVSAVDLAGNRSAPTPEIFVATGDPASVLVFAALADSYVNPDEPGVNYGTAPRLRVDGDPPVTTFMTFEVPELAGPVVQATLRVRAESPLGVGYAVAQVDASRWTEEDITFNNAPEAGAEIAVAPPKPADTWVEIDVTAGISGPGTYSFALRGLSSTNHRMSSREGSHAPELIIEIDVTGS